MTHAQIKELEGLLAQKVTTALHVVIAEYERQKLTPNMIQGQGNAQGDPNKYVTIYFETKDCPYADVAAYNQAVTGRAPLLSLLKEIVQSKLNGTFKRYVTTLSEFSAAVVAQIIAKNLTSEQGGISFNSENEAVPDDLVPRITDKHMEQIIKRQLVSWSYQPQVIVQA